MKLDRPDQATTKAVSVQSPSHPSLAAMGLGALGVVFGDIGTSPLYTVKAVLALSGGRPDAAAMLGLLSLIVWTLIVITTIKYVTIAMSAGNDGEGGILALLSLLLKRSRHPLIVAAGLFGAALIYGDGAITPAISVLSALEGLKMVAPSVQSYVLPAAVCILVLLFAVQPFGTESIGKAFGPIMLAWFLVLAVLGIAGVLRHPSVLAALNPLLGLGYLASSGAKGFLALGAIFLCATGAEALYADMGHFGAKPIRLSWLGIVFPSLLLNYAGQAAIILEGAPTDGNIFFRLCPGFLTIPLVVLATMATVIASQSIITGAFSMTKQAIHLGWMPRLKIKQTSDEGSGQIYVGTVNWILMAATLALTLGFKKSDNLASAYGIAVSLTMLMTTVLLFIAMRQLWKWSLPAAGAVAGILLIVDLAFVSANAVKISEGGYIPLLLASGIYAVMWIWHHGSSALHRRLSQEPLSIADFADLLAERQIPRVTGTAVFLTGTDRGVPPSLVWHVDHNRALHEHVVLLKVVTASTPRTLPAERLAMEKPVCNIWRAQATFGFMERPDIPAILEQAAKEGGRFSWSDVTYYIGRAIVLMPPHRGLVTRLETAFFAVLDRNSSHVSDMLRLPPDSTVELGRQVVL